MAEKYTVEQLNKLNKKDLMLLVLSMQDQLTQMNDNLEKLIEQIRIANQQRFGRHTETLDAVSGQLSLFNEAEALSEDTMEELTIEEVLATVPKQKKQRGKRDADLSGFPEEKILHSVSQEKLNEMYGDGNYKRMPDESYKRLRYEPASWTVEVHTVEVYVGTDGGVRI